MPTALAPLSEDLIREADGLFLGLLRNALVGVYIIQDDLFRYVSPRFAEILGRSQEEICRQLGPDDLIDARDRETMRRAVADRIDGRSEAAHYSFRVERADGTPIEAEVFGMRTEFGGRPAIIGMMVDITGRRADGYHLLQSHFRLIDWSDMLDFERRDDGLINQELAAELADPTADLLGISPVWATPTKRDADPALGKYNGLGGKLEPDEDVVAGLRRELREEAGIEISAWRLRGTVSWPGFGADGEAGLSGRASLSTKHTLALTNRGFATAADILARLDRPSPPFPAGVQVHDIDNSGELADAGRQLVVLIEAIAARTL